MDTEVIEQSTATSEAESYAEHKAARTSTQSPDDKGVTHSGENKQEPKSIPSTTDNGRGDAGTVAADKPGSDATKPDRPKRNRDAEARISQLTDDLKRERADRDRIAKDLEEARKPKPAESAAPKTSEGTAEKTSEDPKPKLADYVKALKAEETYEDAVERHADALLDWKDKQRDNTTRAAEQERQQRERATAQDSKVSAAREKHDDFDGAMTNIRKDGPNPLTPAMLQFVVEHPDGFEVAYALGKNTAEHARIAKLPPSLQVAEMAYMARGLNGSDTAPKKVPVSKAPPPAEPLKAAVGEPHERKTTGEAMSYSEHKRLRNAGR